MMNIGKDVNKDVRDNFTLFTNYSVWTRVEELTNESINKVIIMKVDEKIWAPINNSVTRLIIPLQFRLIYLKYTI